MRDESAMQFVVKAYDGSDMLDKRMTVRPRHLEGMKNSQSWFLCLVREAEFKGIQKPRMPIRMT